MPGLLMQVGHFSFLAGDRERARTSAHTADWVDGQIVSYDAISSPGKATPSALKSKKDVPVRGILFSALNRVLRAIGAAAKNRCGRITFGLHALNSHRAAHIRRRAAVGGKRVESAIGHHIEYVAVRP